MRPSPIQGQLPPEYRFPLPLTDIIIVSAGLLTLFFSLKNRKKTACARLVCGVQHFVLVVSSKLTTSLHFQRVYLWTCVVKAHSVHVHL